MMKESPLDDIAEIPNADHEEPQDDVCVRCDDQEVCVPCSMCQRRVPELMFFGHKQQHATFNLIGYKFGEKPMDIESLNSQRLKAISHRTNSSPYQQKERQKINRSYEIIRRTLFSNMEYTSLVTTQDFKSVQVYRKETNNALIRSIVICANKNASWQEDMEDTFTVLDRYGKRENTTFVGLFDGCNGITAAQSVSIELPVFFLSQIVNVDLSYNLTDEESHFISSFDTVFKESYKEREKDFSSSIQGRCGKGADFEMIHASYATAYWRMDKTLKLGRGENSLSKWSGCAAVTCLIDGHPDTDRSKQKDDPINISNDTRNSIKPRLGVLHVANLGNIKAVLCRNRKSYCLTEDHSTSSYRERSRVTKAGGSLSSNEEHGLVEGLCRITRGLGFHGDAKLKNSVIPAPCTVSIPIYESCQFIVLATSGLWEVLSEKEAVAIILESYALFLQYAIDKKIKVTNDRSGEKRPEPLDSSDHNRIPGRLEGVDGEYEPLDSLPCSNSYSDHTECSIQDLNELQSDAAAYACKQVVKTAIVAGSQQNVTVCLILLPGSNNMCKLN
uniref:Protein phosphatase 2C like domain containing 1 n=1 Tax=Leptobrachium leishanense TaxID=445787 RepID=A0A8C5W6U7_9ANUR